MSHEKFPTKVIAVIMIILIGIILVLVGFPRLPQKRDSSGMIAPTVDWWDSYPGEDRDFFWQSEDYRE